MFKDIMKLLTNLAGNAGLQFSSLKAGDSIKLFGGYDYDPSWLKGKDKILAKVIKFIPGQDSEPAAVVKIAQPIEVDSIRGEILVLELRYEGAKWFKKGTVHIELCDFIPEDTQWKNRRQGLWVEAVASYAVL